MKFPELCERLIRETGKAKVRSNAYLGLGAPLSEQPRLILWVHDGVFEVGSEERGEWNSDRKFSSEDAACDYLFGYLTRKPELWVQTPEEEQHSREVTEETNRKWEARQEYWRQHGEYPPEDQ